MLRRWYFIIISSAVLLFAAYYVYNKWDKNETVPEDIFIEAVLKPNSNPNMDYKDYLLEVYIDKRKYSQHMIYPYISGLHSMSFDAKEDEGFFRPSSIGSAGDDEVKVADALHKHNISQMNYDNGYLDFIGFWSPPEQGKHKLKMYFEANDNFNSLEDMYLVYVHKEKGIFGQDLGWTKVVKIQAE
ncbi:hypothetical protein [Paenibacillus woosongensis]|uniref:Uncharacterized protein n=1 Tax=Paenibacillus woosongensis TaxID=307580 RepID=A0ABQ4MRD8_9BACL|nr:hypothetical protein [Paenibacillus woosongensis]GIP58566.1 hypothetical protein J15TS10_23800 [Paenibacillus woosongensis]